MRVAHHLGIAYVVEQPAGSLLWKLIGCSLERTGAQHAVWCELGQHCACLCERVDACCWAAGATEITTYLGAFGGKTLKPVTLKGTWSKLGCLRRQRPAFHNFEATC